MHFHLSDIRQFSHAHAMTWAVLLSALVVSLAATIGRATINLRGALTAEDASLAVMVLLPDEEISDVTLLRAGVDTQEFLAETKTGPKFIKVKRGETQWFVEEKIELRE